MAGGYVEVQEPLDPNAAMLTTGGCCATVEMINTCRFVAGIVIFAAVS
ncbi:MAG TPA: hypothetical protein VG253_18425 [Streptosporangiaceae bacterium]|jgi:hypothetical protein|nr:hypothetical protein [Streptosporangiaceae bacterium]